MVTVKRNYLQYFLILVILCSSMGYGQFRDSAGYLIASPSGKKVKLANFSIGDTNTTKRAGAIAYMSNGFYFSNGTSWFLLTSASGGSLDTTRIVYNSATIVKQNAVTRFDSIQIGVPTASQGVIRMTDGASGILRIISPLLYSGPFSNGIRWQTNRIRNAGSYLLLT